LKYALESAPFPENTVLIIDTGTHPTLVEMGIVAADVVLIPVMLSQQTAKPTINTLKVLTGIPYSRTILRGRWRYGTFPKKFIPVMDEICQFIFHEQADEERSKKANPAPNQDQDHLGGNGRGAQFDYALHAHMEAANGR